MEELVKNLQEGGWLKSPAIIRAFRAINREDFVPDDVKNFAYLDIALPIGWGQTISQPAVVAFMLELLQPKEGEKVLDIGAGSGWTTALLSQIVGPKGRIVAIEIIPELAEFGKKNIAKYNFLEKGIANFLCKNGAEGESQESPFDRILISAALPSDTIPLPLQRQLRNGGTLVSPIGDSIWRFQKVREKEFSRQEYPGFVFVPFIQKK
ncbi:MAG: protein-L-isoaspartate O-methyltransferase [Candidatus Wildermuthbacteria bacterium]|nr:protein-L-isoaspartate O-methyltransferase [Candidatus Wildermuthbacteria bacterium]